MTCLDTRVFQYLEAVQRIQMKSFWASPMGQLVLFGRASGGESVKEARAALKAEKKGGKYKKAASTPGPAAH